MTRNSLMDWYFTADGAVRCEERVDGSNRKQFYWEFTGLGLGKFIINIILKIVLGFRS